MSLGQAHWTLRGVSPQPFAVCPCLFVTVMQTRAQVTDVNVSVPNLSGILVWTGIKYKSTDTGVTSTLTFIFPVHTGYRKSGRLFAKWAYTFSGTSYFLRYLRFKSLFASSLPINRSVLRSNLGLRSCTSARNVAALSSLPWCRSQR